MTASIMLILPCWIVRSGWLLVSCCQAQKILGYQVEYPIDRHYQLTFLTKCEAMIFATAYNEFLTSDNNNETAKERQGDEEVSQEGEEIGQGEVEQEEVEQDESDYDGYVCFEGQHTQDPFADYLSD